MKLHFHTGKMLPDAVPWTYRERNSRQSMPTFRVIRSKAVWIKAIWFLPYFGMPLNEIRWNIDFSSSRNKVLSKPIIAHRFTGEQPTSRIQAHSFVDDLPCIRKPRQIDQLRTRSQGVQFFRQLVFDFGVLGDQIPNPIQSARRGLVTSND